MTISKQDLGTGYNCTGELNTNLLHSLDLTWSDHGVKDKDKSLPPTSTSTCTLEGRENKRKFCDSNSLVSTVKLGFQSELVESSGKKIRFAEKEKSFPQTDSKSRKESVVDEEETREEKKIPKQLSVFSKELLLWLPTKDVILQSLKNPSITGVLKEKILLSLSQVAKDQDFFLETSQYVQNVLKESSSTLRIFGVTSPIGFLNKETLFSFPPLPAVSLLIIGSRLLPFSFIPFQSNLIFPLGMKLEAAFPNLNAVSLCLPHRGKLDKWVDYFDVDLNPVLSVKVLFLSKTENFPMDWMKRLNRIFPNIEQLIVKSHFLHYPDAALTGLWNFSRLKTLALEIHVPSINNLNTARAGVALESTFTGFPLPIVSMLRRKGASDLRDLFMLKSKMHRFRKYRSIFSVLELDNLQLVLIDDSEEIRTSYPPLLTHVTGLFAFRMRRRLRVRLGVKTRHTDNFNVVKKALRYVIPFVTSLHTNLPAQSNGP